MLIKLKLPKIMIFNIYLFKKNINNINIEKANNKVIFDKNHIMHKVFQLINKINFDKNHNTQKVFKILFELWNFFCFKTLKTCIFLEKINLLIKLLKENQLKFAFYFNY